MAKDSIELILNTANVLAADGGKGAPLFKGIAKAVEQGGEQLEDPETWRMYKQTVLTVMGFIPATIPYVGLASIVFDIIIGMLEADKKPTK